jgi:hypothetical protein
MFVMMSSFSQTDSSQQKYIDEIKTFHQKRITNLKKETGWLNLAGLFLLQEGDNTFGTSIKNKLVFPKGKCPAFAGKLVLKNKQVSIETKNGVSIWNGKQKISKAIIYKNEEEDPMILQYKSLRWFVIKRGNDYYVRLRDLESNNVKTFKDIPTYPININWIIEATLDTTTKNKIEVNDVLGNTNLEESAGTVVFTINGITYRLDALDEGDNLFIIFADKTNESETYYTGRFLNANKPDANGKVYLDFNKATNPPCAFTDFATCPLPPKQNVLTISITAGEKRVGK